MQPSEIAQELEQRGVALRTVPSDEYEFLCPFDSRAEPVLFDWATRGGGAGFKLLDQDVDFLYLVGFEKDRLANKAGLPVVPGVQAQYVVTDIESSLALDAERSRKRKGLFGLLGRSKFAWRMGRRTREGKARYPRLAHLATWLNEDEILRDMLSAGDYGRIYVDPDLENDCVIIWRRALLGSPVEVAEFLAPANVIARRAKVLARFGHGR
jgi:hypothetical protein